MLDSLIADRHLIAELTRRDIRSRYVGSLLGSAWAVIQPLALILIFTVVFSVLGRAEFAGAVFPHRYQYSIYLCAGLLPWLFVSDLVQRGTTQFVELANLIKKVAFRKPVLLWSVTFSSAVSFLVAFGLFLVFLAMVGDVRVEVVGCYLLLVVLMAIAGLGKAALLACLNVYLRDTKQMVAIVAQLWFWATPLVWYPTEQMPGWLMQVERFNPLYWYVRLMQDVMLFGKTPHIWQWLLVGCWSAGCFLLGSQVLSKLEGDLADEL